MYIKSQNMRADRFSYLIFDLAWLSREVSLSPSTLNKATISNRQAELKSSCNSLKSENKYSYFLSCSTLLAQGVVYTWFHFTLGTTKTLEIKSLKGIHSMQLKMTDNSQNYHATSNSFHGYSVQEKDVMNETNYGGYLRNFSLIEKCIRAQSAWSGRDFPCLCCL